jgi:AGZA family xanthine/uracil permease-like MFS transporter
MGGRAAYTLVTAVFIGLAGGLGWFSQLFDWIPEAACFPILVFVGLEIGGQSFRATPVRHYAAVALAILPALAYMATIPMEMALGPDRQPVAYMAPTMLALRCLAHGFIITSLLWASALSAILDRHMFRAAAFLVVAAACSLVGVIHSPLSPEQIAWPWAVVAEMTKTSPSPALLCQSPYHWAGGYLLAAILLVVLGAIRTGGDEVH